MLFQQMALFHVEFLEEAEGLKGPVAVIPDSWLLAFLKIPVVAGCATGHQNLQASLLNTRFLMAHASSLPAQVIK